MAGDLIEHGAVGGVAGGDLQRHHLALVVDHEGPLEPIEPPHGGLATGGQAVEDPWRSMRRLWQTASLVASAK